MLEIYCKIVLMELSLDDLDLKSYNLNIKEINKIKKELINLKNNINSYIKDIKEVRMIEKWRNRKK